MKDITKALAFIAESYEQQGPDHTGRPYITHPIQVLNELVQADITDHATLIAGLLHDIRQYTSTTGAQIASLFGNEVAELTDELYYDPEPNPDLRFLLLDRQVDLSDKAQQIVIADLIANTADDYYDSCGTDLTKRARGAFARALVDETPVTPDALHDRFKAVMAEFCSRNSFNEDESFWGFVDEDERIQHILKLEREVALLREEVGDVTE